MVRDQVGLVCVIQTVSTAVLEWFTPLDCFSSYVEVVELNMAGERAA